MAALPPDPVARFRADCAALVGAGERLGVALSGGPDSLALLLLAHAAFPGRVQAATVDHRLRPESAAEAAFAARICAGRGVPHAILAGDEPIEGNVQSAARMLRYRLLAKWAQGEGIGVLITAHHRDDQAETLLMRLQRGAGLSGLSGIRAVARIAGMPVARPLLGWSRAELAALVAGAGIDPVVDPSNADERYDRPRVRRLIAEAGWIDAAAFARSAAALAEAEQALEWALERLIAERLSEEADGLAFDPAGVPAELRRRALLHLLAMLAPADPPRGEAIQRLLAALEAGETATLAGVRCAGGALWRFTPEPPRRAR
jgi:tRNA(Ile)-lysidine synthase